MLFTSEFTLRGSQEDLMLLKRSGLSVETYRTCCPRLEVRLPGTVAISVIRILRCTPRWEDWVALPVYTFRAQDLPPLKQEKHSA